MGILFVLPSLCGVIIFYMVPFILSMFYCFTTGIVDRRFVGLENFKALFHNEAYGIAVKSTAFIIGIALPLLCILALSLALIVERNLRKYRFLQGWLLIPMAIPVASMVLVWEDLFRTEGVLSAILGSHNAWLDSQWAPFIMIGMIIWKNIGYDMLLIISSLLTLPIEYEESASLEGAGSIIIALWIKVPQLVPMLFFMGIISLFNCFKIFREVYLLRGDYPNKNLYILQHFMNNNFANLNYEMLTTAACVLYMLIFCVIFLVTKWQQSYIETML